MQALDGGVVEATQPVQADVEVTGVVEGVIDATLATGTTAPKAAESLSTGGYDPSMPQEYDPSQLHEPSFDPSQPQVASTDQVVSTGHYDPSEPQTVDPSEPQHYDPSEPQHYDPSEPQSYDPSQPQTLDQSEPYNYDPSLPQGQSESYDPSLPAADVNAEQSLAEPESSDVSDMMAPVTAPGLDAAVLPTDALDPSHAVAVAIEPNANGSSSVNTSTATPIPYDSHQQQQLTQPDVAFKASLPEGILDSSPSVTSNADIIRQWRQDPSDSALVLTLFNWAVQHSEVADARAWYTVLAIDNPTAFRPLLDLIDLELKLSNFSQAEELFGRALRSSATLMAAPDVGIWKAYLHYIRRQNSGDGAEARNTVTQAYEFALKECGIDRQAGEIWKEYIDYLQQPKSKNPWEVQQQIDTVRKIFQRAVAIPLNNVELLWKAYDAFEGAQNKQTAKKFLAERSPAYMTARTALRDLRNHTDSLPNPALPPLPDFSDEDRRVVSAWRSYLKWEENNPLQSEDSKVVAKRVIYALTKCLAQMRHFPELWHYAATYFTNAGDADQALATLKAGVVACPKSFIVNFALAELEESRHNYTACHATFESLVSSLNKEIEDLKTTVAAEVEAARGPEIPIQSHDMEMDNDESDVAKLVREREERGALVAKRRGVDIDNVKTAVGVAWVMYMRFARRAEGLKAARLVFGKARKSPNLSWLAYEASAMMEYHSNKDSSVAIRIFELGLKHFSEDVNFVVKYLEFLLSVNDENNARALFERSALKIPAEKARPLWEAWSKFEYMFGDLPAVLKLEARLVELYPNDSALKRFAQRYTYNGVDEIALRDLGVQRRGATGSAAPQAPAPKALIGAPNMSGGHPPIMPPFPPTSVHTGSPSRGSPIKRDRSPPPSPGRGDFKRARGASPIPSRIQPGRFNAAGRERSPVPPPRVPVAVAGRTAVIPPTGPAAAANVPAYQQWDNSGIPRPLAWFLGQLPTARSFDGPIFRSDDIIGLFRHVAPNGQPIPAAAAAAPGVAVGPYGGNSPAGAYGGNSPAPAFGGNSPHPPNMPAHRGGPPPRGPAAGFRGPMRGRY